MYCKDCGKEIDDNSIFCIYCKTPTELTPSPSLIEDGEIPVWQNKDNSKTTKKVDKVRQAQDSKETPKSKKSMIYTIVSLVIIALMIVIFLFNTSYSRILSKADSAFAKKDYEIALEYYEKAINKKSDGIDALVGAGETSYLLEDFENAAKYFEAGLEVYPDSEKAFEGLLRAYIAIGDYEKLIKSEEYAKTPGMAKIYNGYMTSRPVFSKDGGEYKESVVLDIKSSENSPVYYTLDGSDPREGRGFLFEKPIELGEGTTTVRAICLGDNGYGVEEIQTYVITLEIPPYPQVTPNGGRFDTPTNISIKTSVDNANIYYTWDGSTPTSSSAKYSGPIPMEEGNNILSIVVINSQGISSEVLQCNYTYIPPFEVEE